MSLHVLELTLQKMPGSFFHWLVFGNFLKNPFSKTFINIFIFDHYIAPFCFQRANEQFVHVFVIFSATIQDDALKF